MTYSWRLTIENRLKKQSNGWNLNEISKLWWMRPTYLELGFIQIVPNGPLESARGICKEGFRLTQHLEGKTPRRTS